MEPALERTGRCLWNWTISRGLRRARDWPRIWESAAGCVRCGRPPRAQTPGAACRCRRKWTGTSGRASPLRRPASSSFQKISEELTAKQISKLGDDLTYPGDEKPVRPSPEFTKVLPQEQMNGGGKPSGLMAKLGFTEPISRRHQAGNQRAVKATGRTDGRAAGAG